MRQTRRFINECVEHISKNALPMDQTYHFELDPDDPNAKVTLMIVNLTSEDIIKELFSNSFHSQMDAIQTIGAILQLLNAEKVTPNKLH